MIYCGNRAPVTALQAQFSLSYGVAHALAYGNLDPGAYAPGALADPEVRRLESLIVLDVEPEISAGRRGARLTVVTAGGTEAYSVDHVAGDPESPLSPEQVRAKFERYAAPLLGERCASGIAEAVLEGDLSARVNDVLHA